MKKIILILFALSLALLHAVPIKSIKYIGNTSISDNLAAEITKIKIGDEMSAKAVDKAVVELFKQGYFEDVYADFTNGELTFYFKQRPKIASVEIKGYGSDSEKEQIYSQLGIKKGDSLDETRLERAKTIVKAILEYQGFYGSVINDEVTHINDEAVAIVLRVNQGENITIKKAKYDGRQKLKIKEIEELSANKARQLAGWMWGRNDGKLKLMELEIDNARIQDTYMRKGFLDANVSPAFLEADFSDHSAQLYYTISEGVRYKISGVDVRLESPVMSERKIIKKLKIKRNEYFNIENLRADMEIIKQEVADLGYAFARVSPDLQKSPSAHEGEGEVNVIYYVQLGKKVHINDVIISGNTRTADRIIRRELLLAPTDQYSLSQLKRSENALRRLGYFDKIEIQERRVSEDSMDLLVNVNEAKTGELMFGFGYGSYDQFMVNASLRERNLFGTGHIGQLYADWSIRRQLFNITLSNPRILDSEYSESISGFISTYYNWDYQERTSGGSLTFGRMLSDTLRISLGYTISTTTILSFYDNATKAEYERFFAQAYNGVNPMNQNIKSAVTPSIYFDNSDDYYFPKNGVIASAYVEYAGVGGQEKYTKIYGKFAVYQHLKSIIGLDLIARYKMQAGAIYDQGYAPITSKFYMGGINSVRGYQISSLTPRWQSSGSALDGIRIGGNYLQTHSVELSYGLLEKAQMRLALFYDYGMIGINRMDETARRSWGFALEWVSPIGPLVLVFPRAIDPKPYDRTSSFEFTMGTRF